MKIGSYNIGWFTILTFIMFLSFAYTAYIDKKMVDISRENFYERISIDSNSELTTQQYLELQIYSSKFKTSASIALIWWWLVLISNIIEQHQETLKLKKN